MQVQANHYYPYGATMGEGLANSTQSYKYGGKELDTMNGLNQYDFGARQQDSALGIFTTVDPMAEKYPSISPYAYCASNPILYVDPTGMIVTTADEESRRNILNTLTPEEAKYVSFDKEGRLDINLLNQNGSVSENFLALQALANSTTSYIFAVADKDINGSKFFEKGSNSENPNNFSYGVTNMPGMENDSSPNNNVYIFTASFLDNKTQARNTAHEGYGHAYFFELSKKKSEINPNHTRGVVGSYMEYDTNLKMNVPYFIFGLTNTALENQIKKVEKQAIRNYEIKNK